MKATALFEDAYFTPVLKELIGCSAAVAVGAARLHY
jgi:hypothetical protein